jgi:Icc-related predicted phosphoesterase
LGNQWALQPWGEAVTKQFVHEAINEAVELESALVKLRTPQRIIVLHYPPIRDTVVGEPPEIFAFLGSSQLEELLSRYAVTAVFHGHAHHGTLEGQTIGGAGLHNVAMPLLHKTCPARRPFRLVEIPVTP